MFNIEKVKTNIRKYDILYKMAFLLRSIFFRIMYRGKNYVYNYTKPLSNIYGLERGMPIDRYYIENFLEKNRVHIKGNCLEILDNKYTKKFGNNVTTSDILDIDQLNKNATIVDDLRSLRTIKDNTYDCVILTQTLQFIDDSRAAIKECHRVIKPCGVLLCTVPCVSRIDCVSGVSGDFWRFTVASVAHLFSDQFKKSLHIESIGNVYSGVNFLIGASVADLDKKKLLKNDKNFPCIITIVAIK